jgi:hypothetical protein
MKKVQRKISSKKQGSEQRTERKSSTGNHTNTNINESTTGYSGYVFANTPLNMEDEERNPDCCW